MYVGYGPEAEGHPSGDLRFASIAWLNVDSLVGKLPYDFECLGCGRTGRAKFRDC